MLADAPDDTPERILGEDGGRAYRNYIDWTQGVGFALAIMEIALPRDRQALLEWTKRQLPETRAVDMAAADNKPMRPLLNAAVAKPGVQLLALMRLDEPLNRKALFARMNIQRDELARDYPFPWVIMIHPVAALEMTMLAPDLLHFAGVWLREQAKADAPPPALRTLDTTSSSTVSHEGPKIEGSELLQQAQEMLDLRRLDEAADLLAQADLYDPPGRTTNGWRIALGGWLTWLRGEPEKALLQLDKAREAFERVGDERGRAVTLGRVADILQARGEVDEALRIHRAEQLPVYERIGDVRERAVAIGKVADILQARGQLDEALRLYREEELPVYERIGDVRARAVTLGRVADILQARGQLDEALRIRRDEELPVYEHLGDVRARAVTMGKVADIFEVRGELDEALRIRREEELPIYERLGDVHARAVTLGQVADILEARGQLDEALRIRREEELPVFERLGDVRERAVTLGRVADILQARGQLDEALRIRREEELPVYERLDAVRDILVARAKSAQLLLARNQPGDAVEARRLLGLALDAARQLRIPEAAQIEEIMRDNGWEVEGA